MTSFAAFARLSLELKQTAGRLASMERIGDFLRGLGADEIRPAVLMLLGRVRPAGDKRKLDISASTLARAVRAVGGAADVHSGEHEDIGASIRHQLVPVLPTVATAALLEVHIELLALTEISGKGAAARRQAALEALLRRMTAQEVEVLARVIVHDMRHGADEGVVLEALARLLDVPRAAVSRAQMLLGDVSRVAEIGLLEGASALAHVGIEYFRPLQPMLAQKADDVAHALSLCAGVVSLEHKLDGARLQIHIADGTVRLFTRRLSEVTESLPDVVEAVRDGLALRDGIAEGELVPIDADGRMLAFQQLMRRFKRVHEVEKSAQEVGVRLFLFDLLAADGEVLLDQPLHVRQARLEAALRPTTTVQLVPRLVTDDSARGQAFYDDAVGRGYEGVMAKNLESVYSPGVRGRAWLKIKKIHTLDVAVVAADWGYGRRRGWLSNYHLAVRDGDALVEVGKTFKGMTDAEFTDLTARLLALRLDETNGFTVRVRPEIVLEVAYSDVQASPQYACGYALRFARVVRIRDDKTVDDIDRIEAVREQFERQQSAAF